MRFNGSVISQGNCFERRDLRKSIVGSLDRIDYPLLSGPYSGPVSLLIICRSREQAECRGDSYPICERMKLKTTPEDDVGKKFLALIAYFRWCGT